MRTQQEHLNLIDETVKYYSENPRGLDRRTYWDGNTFTQEGKDYVELLKTRDYVPSNQ